MARLTGAERGGSVGAVQCVMLIRATGADDAELAHADAIRRTLLELPNLRFISSYRTQGSVDFVDVLELDEQTEDAARVAALLAQDGTLAVEALPAQASAALRAPGGPGAPG